MAGQKATKPDERQDHQPGWFFTLDFFSSWIARHAGNTTHFAGEINWQFVFAVIYSAVFLLHYSILSRSSINQNMLIRRRRVNVARESPLFPRRIMRQCSRKKVINWVFFRLKLGVVKNQQPGRLLSGIRSLSHSFAFHYFIDCFFRHCVAWYCVPQLRCRFLPCTVGVVFHWI